VKKELSFLEMNKKSVRMIILCFCLAVLLSGCRRREPGLYRLIDHFEKGDVLASPLRVLEKYFRSSVLTWRDSDFQRMVLDSRVYWAASPPFPIAAQYDFEEAPDVAVLREREKLNWSPIALRGAYSWSWLKGEKRVEFEDPSKESGSKRSLVLKKGATFGTSLMLPPGTAIIKVLAKSGGSGYLPCLEVGINDQKSREIYVGQSTDFEFTEEMKFGENKIHLAFQKSLPASTRQGGGENESLFIELVTIKVLHDLILISPPEGETGIKGTFELRYVPEPVDKIIPIRRTIENSKPLEMILDFESPGKRALQILARPLIQNGIFKLTVGAHQDISRISVPAGVSSLMLELEAGKPREVVRMIYEPEEKTQLSGRAAETFYIDSIIIPNPIRERYLPLYHLNGFRLYDGGIGQNPYNIKKKLKIRLQTVNCLFAPPPSIYKFPMKVPEGGTLRLGYGLLTEAWDNESNGVTFEVLLEEAGKTKLIHRAKADPYHRKQDQKIFYQDLDLSPYANKRVTIYLKTGGFLRREGKTDEKTDFRNDFSFWVSPLLVQKQAPGAEGELPLNIILISIDTLRADHLSCYGYQRQTSPNIDELSRDSALFLNTLSHAPLTLPSHMTMLTGLVPTNHQVLYVYQSLNPDVTTLADVLRSSGYLTGAFTDGALVSARYGFSKGFESFHEEALGYFIPNSAELLYQKASAWIKRSLGPKFFLFLHTYQPHDPYKSPPPWGQVFLKKDDIWTSADLSEILGRGHPHLFKELKPSERENLVSLYDGEIRYTDEFLIKPLISELKRLRLYERTMIVLTSDHGEEFFEHGGWAHSLSLYNEEIKVPLIIKYPHSKHKGKRITQYRGLVDIMPTILEEVGLSSSGLGLDGKSVSGVFDQKEKKQRAYMSFRGDSIVNGALPKRVAIIRSPYKFILNEKYPAQAYEYFSPPPPRLELQELYNLDLDPLEKRNLADQERNLAREMMREAEAYLTGIKKGTKSHDIALDKAFEEKLKALGYIH
jgi:arylsulfatase A-like enzyme